MCHQSSVSSAGQQEFISVCLHQCSGLKMFLGPGGKHSANPENRLEGRQNTMASLLYWLQLRSQTLNPECNEHEILDNNIRTFGRPRTKAAEYTQILTEESEGMKEDTYLSAPCVSAPTDPFFMVFRVQQ